MGRDLAHLALVEPEQRDDVARAVAVLGVEAGDVFGRVVGAEHEPAEQAGDFVLRDHARARLDVAAREVERVVVMLRQPHRGEALQGRVVDRVGTRAHVDADAVTRLDEIQRGLRIFFVGLGRIGQAHRDEAVAFAAVIEFVDRELREPPAGAGIDPAADAEHEGFRAAQFQLVLNKVDPPANFPFRADFGLHHHGGYDVGLFHGVVKKALGGGDISPEYPREPRRRAEHRQRRG